MTNNAEEEENIQSNSYDEYAEENELIEDKEKI
jgi:hypothetical protein